MPRTPGTYQWSITLRSFCNLSLAANGRTMVYDPGKIATREALVRALQEALSHLYDPNYQPPAWLYTLTGCDHRQGPAALQSALFRLIQSLEPPADAPLTAPVRLIFDLLYSRYVLRLTQEQTAERLHVSVATAWRLQRKAIHAIARALCESGPARQEPLAASAEDWRSQAARELAALQASTPEAVVAVTDAVHALCGLWPALSGGRDAHLRIAHLQPNLVAKVHPSALHQMLVTAARRLARHIAFGDITLFAGLVDGNVRITLTGPIATSNQPTEQDLVCDIVAPANTIVEAQIEGGHAFLWLEMPSPSSIIVLVMDDNLDMADFYQRATEGTNYRIVHTTDGRALLETVEATRPDIIVLDIMLPDIDGWQLLMRLHEHPGTQAIPVIVCSVVREEELSLSLGAALYLPKPVRPREFIEALDRVCCRAATASTRV